MKKSLEVCGNNSLPLAAGILTAEVPFPDGPPLVCWLIEMGVHMSQKSLDDDLIISTFNPSSPSTQMRKLRVRGVTCPVWVLNLSAMLQERLGQI